MLLQQNNVRPQLYTDTTQRDDRIAQRTLKTKARHSSPSKNKIKIKRKINYII